MSWDWASFLIGLFSGAALLAFAAGFLASKLADRR